MSKIMKITEPIRRCSVDADDFCGPISDIKAKLDAIEKKVIDKGYDVGSVKIVSTYEYGDDAPTFRVEAERDETPKERDRRLKKAATAEKRKKEKEEKKKEQELKTLERLAKKHGKTVK